MKIAINALSVQGGGGLTFLKNLLQHLLRLDHENEYLLLVTQAKINALGLEERYPNFRLLICPPRGWVARGLWEQFVLPRVLNRERTEVLYAPGNQAPIFCRVPFVVFIQNVDPLAPALREYGPSLRCKTAIGRLLMRASVVRASKVIAVSEHTRQLIGRAFGYPGEKIAVVPHGSPNGFVAGPNQAARVAEALRSCRPFLLAVSAIKPNKNYEALVRAFALACARVSEPLSLLIAGDVEDRGCFSRVQRIVREAGLTARVRFLGGVDAAELRVLYEASEGLVFPSKRESFGLPPLEAMAYGVPVAASRIEPVVEVCGEAACYFDPEDPEEMAETMIEIVKNAALRKSLIHAGLARAKLFSWELTARRTLEILREASQCG